MASKLFGIGNLLVILGFFIAEISPLFLSLGTILVIVSILLNYQKTPKIIFEQSKNIYPFIFLILVWVVSAFTILYVDNTERYFQKLSTSLPLLILAFTFILPINFSIKKYLMMLVFVTSFFALASLFNLILNYERLSAGIVHSKQIPVWPENYGVSHIYFSVLQSFVVLFCLFSYITKDFENKYFTKNIILILGVFNFLALHILSSRTGLVALYFSLGLVMFFYFISNKQVTKYIWLLLVFLSLPFLAYFFIGTFQARVDNTITDFKIMKNGEDINHRSFAMRMEASKNGLAIIEDHYLLGVGFGDLDSAMQQKYRERKTTLFPENRVLPHNQFIETYAENGILAFVFLVCFFGFNLISGLQSKDYLLISTSLLFVFSFGAESMLERQVGITFFVWIFGLILNFQLRKTNSKNR